MLFRDFLENIRRMAVALKMTETVPDLFAAVRSWLDGQRQRSDFAVQRIPWAESKEWGWQDGRWQHHTGRFFTVEGLHINSNHAELDGHAQPIIRQPEIGILGYLAQERDGELHLLVQAKTEPGNVGIAQLAPTFQATVSNYTCVHRGTPPPFGEFFLSPAPGSLWLDQLHSEQGTRFFRKTNRNMVAVLPPGRTLEHDATYRWLPARAVVQLLRHDNLLNTDSRSVLACLPWKYLCAGNEAFAALASHDDFALALRDSARANTSDTALENWLAERAAAWTVEPKFVPLQNLPGWKITDDSFEAADGPGEFFVQQMAVTARDREVSQWDQPLFSNRQRGLISQVVQRRQGTLHFLLQALAEPGSHGLALTATVQTADPARTDVPFQALVQKDSGRLHWSGVHSEEGGRFYQDENLYRLVEVPEDLHIDLPADYRWLTLGQVLGLLPRKNLLTNEFRSLLSALMLWA